MTSGLRVRLRLSRQPLNQLRSIPILQVKAEEVELVRRDYTANEGWETFLAYEDPRQDILVGLLRLRRVQGPAQVIRRSLYS